MTSELSEPSNPRQMVFLSKGTPDDDDFALWLAPRLEAAGYDVFADILCLKYGDRWRKILTDTLYDRACKMLLCCKTKTLAKDGVLEEIDIANKLTRELDDPRFIIPLRLERNFRAPFGTAGLQFIDFTRSWADGLENLLDFLDEENVTRQDHKEVNPEWHNYRARRAIQVESAPETLSSNWLRIAELPDTIKYYVPTGAISIGAFDACCRSSDYPAINHKRGVLTFLNLDEVSEIFKDVAALKLECETDTLDFQKNGMPEIDLASGDASNILMSMLRESWNNYCRQQQLSEYTYSSQVGFHAGDNQIGIGKYVPWGKQGDRRSAMLRNVSKGKVWNFGATAIPSFWPYPHFKIKTRVMFSELVGEKEAGDIISNVDQQFRLRRTICKGWRNKQWYGRLQAFLEVLSGESTFINLPLSPSQPLKVISEPVTFTSPVTTMLPDQLGDDFEETDDSVLMGTAPTQEDEADGAS